MQDQQRRSNIPDSDVGAKPVAHEKPHGEQPKTEPRNRERGREGRQQQHAADRYARGKRDSHPRAQRLADEHYCFRRVAAG